MNVAVRANIRTAAAAMRGLNPALRVAFSSGTVMGVTVVGIGLLGVTILYLAFQNISAVAGFGFERVPLLSLPVLEGVFSPRPPT